MRLRGRRGRRTTIVVCYRVVQGNGAGLGDSIAFVQQETVLREQGHHNPNPRQHVLSALERFILERHEASEEIILAMDANETIDTSKSQLKSLMMTTGLVDAMSIRHKDPPRTCIKGTRRIDYIFISPTLAPALQGVGHVGIQDAILSDHCGLWIDFNARELFKGNTETLGSIIDAPFTMRQVRKVEQFIEKIESHLQETRVEERLDNLATKNLSLQEYVKEFEIIRKDEIGRASCRERV